MRGQLFGLGNADDVVGSFQELRFRIVDKARFFDKIIDGKRREETRRAAGGQHVVWTREVIAERLRRIVSEEHGTGVIELADRRSALNWYGDIHSVFKKYGIGHALWCYKGKDFGFTDGMLSGISDEIFC